MARAPRTIDEYVAPLSNENRAALEKLRKAIKSAAPGAEECISTSKGTIRFPADAPLPAALVRKLVKTQIAARGTRRG